MPNHIFVFKFQGWGNKCKDESQLLSKQCYCEKMLGGMNRDGKGRDNEPGINYEVVH